MTEARTSRRLGAFALLALVAVFAGVEISRSSVRPVHCDKDLTPGADTVVMLSASWCQYCAAARRYFVREKIEYCEYDVEQDPEGRRRYARMPVKMIPVLTLGHANFIGFEQEEIEKALQARGLRPL